VKKKAKLKQTNNNSKKQSPRTKKNINKPKPKIYPHQSSRHYE
jgi:hypothetical protein